MTRKDAKLIAQDELDYDAEKGRYNSSCDVMEYIDMIYDDFESRTCENCVHWNVSTESEMDGNGDGFIDCMIVYAESFGSITYKDFGCNKFEEKDR